jgi:hypothetical protein
LQREKVSRRIPILFEREERSMPTAIETWRDRSRQERADRRRARLREQLPMGAYFSQSSHTATAIGKAKFKKIKKQEFKQFKKKKKLFGEE